MLCTEADLVHMAPVLFEEVSITARDEVHDVLGVRCELADSVEGALGGYGVRGDFDDGGEGALYVSPVYIGARVITQVYLPGGHTRRARPIL